MKGKKNTDKMQKKITSLLQTGTTYHRAGKIDEAEAAYKQVIKMAPNNADALYLLGVICIQKSDYPKSLAFIERSLEINPLNISAHYNLGLALQSLYKYHKAAISYLTALKIDPDHIASLTNLASTYMYLEKYVDAEEIFRKLVHLIPNNSQMFNNLGLSLFKQGRADRAIEYYNKAYTLNEQSEEVLNNIGFALQHQGHLHDSEAYYDKALSYADDYGIAWNNLGSLLWQLRRFDDARDAYKKAASFEKSYVVANTALAIDSWVHGRGQEVSTFSASALDYVPSEYTANQNKFIQGYASFLRALVEFSDKHSDMYHAEDEFPVLHVIGDSHCLSYNNLTVSLAGERYRVSSHLIIGCKAWSLSNRQENQYKSSFRKILGDLPAGAKVLFIFGEIDCRPDEGLIPYASKKGTDVNVEAETLAQRYVAFIHDELSEKEIQPFLVNVLKPDRTAQFTVTGTAGHLEDVYNTRMSVTGSFNAELDKQCASLPTPIHVLDLYTLVANAPTAMIDGVHINPDVAAELLSGVCVT